MPLTPVYGLPYEAPGDQPLHSLTGGSSGTEPILAESVETELARLDNQLITLQSQIASLPQVIGQGVAEDTTNAGINIAVPPGQYSQLRLTLRGHTQDLTQVAMRINGDSTAMYLHGRITRRASDGGIVTAAHNESGTLFLLGEWSTLSANSAVIDLFGVDGDFFIGHQSRVARMSQVNTNHRITDSWGRITETRLLTHINIRTNTVGVGYSSLRWQLIGIPVGG